MKLASYPMFYTAGDASKLSQGRLTPATFRLAVGSGALEPIARTAGGIALFTRAQIEEYLAVSDARRQHAAERKALRDFNRHRAETA